MPTQVDACHLCGSGEAVVLGTDLAPDRFPGSAGRFGLVRCATCGLVYLSPRPSPDEIGAYYPSEFYETLGASPSRSSRFGWPGMLYDWLFPTSEARRIRGKLALVRRVCEGGRHGAPPRRVLDIGAGDGEFLARLAQEGWTVEGTEFSEQGARSVRERLVGVPVHIGPFEDLDLGSGRFELITLWDVLEHLHRPLDALQKVHRHLAPGGALIVSVPNYGALESTLLGNRWPHLDVPRHLYHFTAGTLERMLVAAGFRGPRITTWDRLLVDHFPGVLFPIRSDWPRRTAGAYARRLVGDLGELALTPIRVAVNAAGLGPTLVGITRV